MKPMNMGPARRPAALLAIITIIVAMALPAAAVQEPANAPAQIIQAPDGRIELNYHGMKILSASFRRQGFDHPLSPGEIVISEATEGEQRITQRITVNAADGSGELIMDGLIAAGPEAFAAETGSNAQARFPLVRNSVGPSRNRRNNAVYDRGWDWVLESAQDRTRILPLADLAAGRQFQITATGATIELVFRPRFYQRHKGIKYFRPWEYRVKPLSVTGWCSWWAYMQEFDEAALDRLLAVWAEQRLTDYGYRFIQIDDTYQRGTGLPENWLQWNEKFPGDMKGYAAKVRAIGADPGIWVNASFPDRDYAREHADWFVRDAQGNPFPAPWVGYTMDATAPGAADALIRPLYRGIREAGFPYVKIDTLRHFLYDGLRNVPAYAAGKGLANADILRAYLTLARDELGADTFVLGCWGVIPETVGLVDSIRLGGDGFGPATLQQYNSWNGVVWRNDPDHCDLRPSLIANTQKKWLNLLNRGLEPKRLKAPPAESIIRPTIASMAGAVLLLSDRPEVYHDPMNLEGAKRSAPVLFTVPGQLYDYEPSRTDQVKTLDPETITTGKAPSPFDARQRGRVASWWELEIDRPFEHWTVLARMNWTRMPEPAATVGFADLGLDPDREYLVYEFWTRKFIGAVRGSFKSPAIAPLGTQVYAIRERLARPQLLSTSRHISQGGVDIERMDWDQSRRTLSGASKVVAQDRYELLIHVPDGFSARSAEFSGRAAEIVSDKDIVRIALMPETTGEITWQVQF
jgi:alpha-galactosidase